MDKRTKRIVVISAIVLLVLIAVFMLIRTNGEPKGTAGVKTVTVQVVLLDGTSKEHILKTNAEFLRGALEEANLVEGTESQFGLYITSVDGVEADEANQEWWRLSKDGIDLMSGVDETPIADADVFSLTLTAGW